MRILALLTSLVMSLGLYPSTFEITTVDYSRDIVTMTDSAGFQYQFEGCEDWTEGDIASAIMFDNGTENITDDLVVMVQYSGYYR